MKFRLLFTLAVIVTFSNTVFAGPFGFEMGMTKTQISKTTELKVGRNPYVYSTTKVPKPYKGIEKYFLTITPETGLCRIYAVSKDIKTNVYGEGLQDEFEVVQSAIDKKYGEGININYLIATKTRNVVGLSFRFQIQTIMKKHFENVFNTWCTPAYSYIRPTVEFAHFPFQRRSC